MHGDPREVEQTHRIVRKNDIAPSRSSRESTGTPRALTIDRHRRRRGGRLTAPPLLGVTSLLRCLSRPDTDAQVLSPACARVQVPAVIAASAPAVTATFLGVRAKLEEMRPIVAASGFAGLACLAALLATSSVASAFCRSTTCRTVGMKECKTDAMSCPAEGAKLFWPTSCVSYAMNEQATQMLDPKDTLKSFDGLYSDEFIR